MKIVGRKEFLQMPEGTVYHRYEPHIMRGLEIKGDWARLMSDNTCGDWIYCDLIGAVDAFDSCEMIDKLQSGECDLDFEISERDGCFDGDEQFAVFEKKDLEKLIKALTEALEKYA